MDVASGVELSSQLVLGTAKLIQDIKDDFDKNKKICYINGDRVEDKLIISFHKKKTDFEDDATKTPPRTHYSDVLTYVIKQDYKWTIENNKLKKWNNMILGKIAELQTELEKRKIQTTKKPVAAASGNPVADVVSPATTEVTFAPSSKKRGTKNKDTPEEAVPPVNPVPTAVPSVPAEDALTLDEITKYIDLIQKLKEKILPEFSIRLPELLKKVLAHKDIKDAEKTALDVDEDLMDRRIPKIVKELAADLLQTEAVKTKKRIGEWLMKKFIESGETDTIKVLFLNKIIYKSVGKKGRFEKKCEQFSSDLELRDYHNKLEMPGYPFGDKPHKHKYCLISIKHFNYDLPAASVILLTADDQIEKSGVIQAMSTFTNETLQKTKKYMETLAAMTEKKKP